LLRLEVGRLRAETAWHRFTPMLHVGSLGGEHVSRPAPLTDPLMDAGTRTELVLRLLEDRADHRSASIWLARPGEPVLEDHDLAWLAAASRAFDAVECPLDGAWSVTRTGWLDLRSGERRTWKRLRIA
jgi:hypothetical protein